MTRPPLLHFATKFDYPLFALGAAACCALAGCNEKQDAASQPPPTVLVAKASQRDVPVIRDWVATLDGINNSEVRAKVSGYLTKQNYQDGTIVKTGDVLFEIDPRPFEADVAQADANVLKAQADQLKTQSDFERAQQLLPSNAISKQDYDTKNQANQAALAEVKAAQAALDQAKLNLGYTKVLAPVDGIAGITTASIGDLVGTASNQVLTTVSTVDPIRATFVISEREYMEVAGRMAEITQIPLEQRPPRLELIFPNGQTYEHKGKFYAIDRQVDPRTGTIQVQGIFPNPGNILRPGQFAKVRLEVDDLKGAIVIPQRAVNEVQGSYQVGIVAEGNKAKIVPVIPGEKTGTDWIITKGLNATDEVIVEGYQKIKDNSPVVPKPYVAAPAPAPAKTQSPAPAGSSTATPSAAPAAP